MRTHLLDHAGTSNRTFRNLPPSLQTKVRARAKELLVAEYDRLAALDARWHYTADRRTIARAAIQQACVELLPAEVTS